MLSGIIGDKVTVDDLKNKFKPDSNKRTKSPKEESGVSRVSRQSRI